MRLPHCILGSILLAGFVTQVSAQTDPCLDRTVPVNVYSEQGAAFTHFPAARFRAKVGGKPARVTSATIGALPQHVVILIDVSGSMFEGGNLKRGLEFARDQISLAPRPESLALLTFTYRIEDILTFGRSRTALLAKLDEMQNTDWLHAKGMHATALVDAIPNALTLMKPPSVGDAICLVTDGGENASRSSWFKAKARLESSGIRVYAFFPNWQSSSPIYVADNFGASALLDLASITGGDTLHFGPGILQNLPPPTSAFGGFEGYNQEILRAAQLFHLEIFQFEQLTVKLPGPSAKPLRLNLEILDDSDRQDKRMQIYYPHWLAPCTP
jgi:hypothetical protein